MEENTQLSVSENSPVNLKVTQNDVIDMIIQENKSIIETERKELETQLKELRGNTPDLLTVYKKEISSQNKSKIDKILSVFPTLSPVVFLLHPSHNDIITNVENLHFSQIEHCIGFVGFFTKKSKKELEKEGKDDSRNPYKNEYFSERNLLEGPFRLVLSGGYPNDFSILKKTEINFSCSIKKTKSLSISLNKYKEHQNKIDDMNDEIHKLGNKINEIIHNRDQFKAKVTRSILESDAEGKKILENFENAANKTLLVKDLNL